MSDKPDIATLAAMVDRGPKAGERFRHVKTRGIYTVVRTALVEATLEIVVVYERGGVPWVRSLVEFRARFVAVPDDTKDNS